MTEKPFTINDGLYLVVDPSMAIDILLPKIEAAINGGVNIIQIWNHWKEDADKISIIAAIVNIAHQKNIAVLINENIEWMDLVDGIHFDELPVSIEEIRTKINRHFIIGITCGNDFEKIEWAIEHKLSYISFCSVFPSGTVNTCELVKKETILKARALTDMPIFLSGGITLDNLEQLKDTGMNGIALISGIMSADKTEQTTIQYKQALINTNN